MILPGHPSGQGTTCIEPVLERLPARGPAQALDPIHGANRIHDVIDDAACDTSSDSGLSSISANGRMSSSELTIKPPNVYISAQFRLPPYSV